MQNNQVTNEIPPLHEILKMKLIHEGIYYAYESEQIPYPTQAQIEILKKEFNVEYIGTNKADIKKLFEIYIQDIRQQRTHCMIAEGCNIDWIFKIIKELDLDELNLNHFNKQEIFEREVAMRFSHPSIIIALYDVKSLIPNEQVNIQEEQIQESVQFEESKLQNLQNLDQDDLIVGNIKEQDLQQIQPNQDIVQQIQSVQQQNEDLLLEGNKLQNSQNLDQDDLIVENIREQQHLDKEVEEYLQKEDLRDLQEEQKPHQIQAQEDDAVENDNQDNQSDHDNQDNQNNNKIDRSYSIILPASARYFTTISMTLYDYKDTNFSDTFYTLKHGNITESLIKTKEFVDKANQNFNHLLPVGIEMTLNLLFTCQYNNFYCAISALNLATIPFHNTTYYNYISYAQVSFSTLQNVYKINSIDSGYFIKFLTLGQTTSTLAKTYLTNNIDKDIHNNSYSDHQQSYSYEDNKQNYENNLYYLNLSIKTADFFAKLFDFSLVFSAHPESTIMTTIQYASLFTIGTMLCNDVYNSYVQISPAVNQVYNNYFSDYSPAFESDAFYEVQDFVLETFDEINTNPILTDL